MATRERRLAEFNGHGEPPPDQPVQVLCEDHSGTYQLPFACRWISGEGAPQLEELSELHWIRPAALADFKTTPGLAGIVAAAFELMERAP